MEEGSYKADAERTNDESSRICENTNSTTSAVTVLHECLDDLNQPVQEELTAKQIDEVAQHLINSLNTKRNNDTYLLQEHLDGLENHTKLVAQMAEEHMFKMHKEGNEQVNGKLQQLFGCLDSITASQKDMDTFKQSLRSLYEEMHS